MTTKLNIIQIVRRFGPVGGMERYVWELSREIAAAGHQLTVLCEELCADAAPEGVAVVSLGGIRKKPRWLAHLRFSKRVSDWLATHPEYQHHIIHSHERTNVHQFTTFHGPPFAKVKDKPWWKRISLRILANLYLERRELCGIQVKAIIPNSTLIANALNDYYPEISKRLAAPITPGVADIPKCVERVVDTDAGVIGFVGKEWKRKGLDMAVKIVTELRHNRPKLSFIVVGPNPDAVRHLFAHWPEERYQLLGETDSAPLYAQFDLLLHPARQEPYGMVIAEARAAGVAVLISDACGIADELDNASVLALDAPISTWAKACDDRMNGINQMRESSDVVIRDWQVVAADQIACYRQYWNT
ncbi:glycosyltransferase [Mariprofundus sp. EBB-1]|uniref:glycosyltransferase family 4 protein n=1 Tax=Mariprofundus sp. EBB-1 TaxID=2650971 RepID=UPI000EF1E075|nr:glycosyltransferase family 4 protein [Mariprofundus sp. EBB-1]RLL52265.1 glycosyltransferase [Mariprofundus sp. EBB-1]